MPYIVEREVVEAVRTDRKVMRKLEDWKQVRFESSTGKTPEFMAFARMYRARIKAESRIAGLDVVSWMNGHFYCSAFLLNRITGKHVYLSCSDVRHFPNGWADDILVRTAEHDKDYTGGQNNRARLETLGESLRRISQ